MLRLPSEEGIERAGKVCQDDLMQMAGQSTLRRALWREYCESNELEEDEFVLLRIRIPSCKPIDKIVIFNAIMYYAII